MSKELRYYYRNKQAQLQREKRHIEHIESILKIRIGSKCKVCGKTEDIHYHKIDGKKHPYNREYLRDHPTEFIPLCRSHHEQLHERKKK